jgi:spermidine synthase
MTTADITPRQAARADNVPEGESGPWRVERFEVAEMASQFGSMFRTGRFVPPGTYTRLMRHGTVVMSDTPDEMRDHAAIFSKGYGRVLVNGLGIGCVIRGLLAKSEVEHIDVVELSSDVIALVGPTFENEPRVTIHHADAFAISWPAGTKWDCAWHDVWDDLCTDNLKGEGSYEKLHRKYGRRVGWQGSWGYEIVRAQHQRNLRERQRYRW